MKKGLKIALIVVLSLVVVAGATLGIAYATNGDYVKNTFALMTKDDDEYFKWVTQKNVDKSLEQSKTMLLSTAEASEKEPAMTMSNELTVEITDKFKQFILEQAGNRVSNADVINILKPISFSSVMAADKENFGSSFAVKFNGAEIVKLASLIRPGAKEAYVAIPSYKSDAIDLSELARTDISKYFDVAQINESFKQMGIDVTLTEADVKDVFTLMAKFSELASKYSMNMLEQDKIEDNIATINNELNKVLNEIDGAVLEKNVEIDVNGVSTECNTVTVKLTQKDIMRIIINIFNEKEAEVKKILLDELKVPAEEVERFLKQAKEALDKAKDDKTINLGVDLVLYVNNRGEYIGANVKIGAANTKVNIKSLTVEEDKNTTKTGYEITAAGVRLLKGTITNVTNGTEKKQTIDIAIGDMIKTVVPQLQNFSFQIESTQDDGNPKDIKNSVEFMVKDGADKLVGLKIDSTVNSEEAILPINLDSANKIAYNKLLDSDYLTIKDVVLYMVDRIEAINDETVNKAFLEGYNRSAGAEAAKSISEIKEKINNTDFSEAEKQLKDSLKQGLEKEFENLGEFAQSFNLAGLELGPVPEPVDDHSLKVDPDIMQAYSKPEYAAYITGFEYSDIDLSDKLSTVDYVELERCKEAFLGSINVEKVLSQDINRTVEFSDAVLFDAIPIVGGFTVKMYEYTKVPAKVGEYQYGVGVDDQLIGLKKGDSKVINITLGNEFGDFAGYNGDFKVTVSGIYDYIYPEWTEEYLCGFKGYPSLEELEQKLIDENGLNDIIIDDTMIYNAAKETIFENFVDTEAFERLYDEKKNEYLSEMSQSLIDSGMSDKPYYDYLLELGNSEEDIELLLENEVKNPLMKEIIISYVAYKENLQTSFRECIEARGISVEEATQDMYESIMRGPGEAAFYDEAISKKAYTLFLENIKANMKEE